VSEAAVLASVLLLVSAVFSGAEAALFTLSGRQRQNAPLLAQALLQDPTGSLTVILLGNLLVNLAYFASAASLGEGLRPSRAAAISAGAVMLLVLCGEIVPKVVAHRFPRRAAKVLLPPVWLLHLVLGAPARGLGKLLFRKAPPVTPLEAEELDVVLAEEGEGLLPEHERGLVRQILELDILRAGAVRRPLADTPRLPAALSLDAGVQQLREQRAAWALVEEEDGEVRGLLDLTRLPRGRTVREAMAPVPVLPEVAPLARGVTLMREQGHPLVLLVDEYGAAAGVLERGRWADTLLDRVPTETETGRSAIRPVSANRFLVDGSLPLHVFRERFGDPGQVDPKLDTLAGLLAERLGRLPEPGDRLDLDLAEGGRVELELLEREGARVAEVELTLRPPEEPPC
jgi:putative hemolysin